LLFLSVAVENVGMPQPQAQLAPQGFGNVSLSTGTARSN
jgi:hypothetical protein